MTKGEIASELSKGISNAEDVAEQISRLEDEQETLLHDICDKTRDTEKMVEELTELTNKIHEAEKHASYLSFVARIEDYRWEWKIKKKFRFVLQVSGLQI